MYQTKSGKMFANPQYGKAMDEAESASKSAKSPSTDLKPEKKKKDPSTTSKDDDKTPTIRIVISTDPSGTGYTTDSGDGVDSHPDKSALMDHLSSILPDDDSDSDASPDSDTIAPSSGPSPSLMDAVKGLTKK